MIWVRSFHNGLVLPVVVHHAKHDFDVDIRRPNKWGNRFTIGIDGDRDQVIAKFAEELVTKPQLMADLPELCHKKLGCWCKPKRCHGDVLVKLLSVWPEVPDWLWLVTD